MANTDQVLRLAAIIREVDGNHSKGAAALAELILDHSDFRAALADEPAVTAPTVMESIELSEKIEAAGLGQVHFARDLLARPEPAPPADGEVADLVAWLRIVAGDEGSYSHVRLSRAAELLQRQTLVPVPVSERMPGPKDCDAIGCCWWYSASHGWELYHRENGLGTSTHWLPAHALPLPEAGE